MEKFDPRTDAYIEKSAEFANPFLKHLRGLIHQASPEISETIKWGFPHSNYKVTICSMASFKAHCAFGFWKSSLLKNPHNILQKNSTESSMGQLGRITSIKDLPANDILIEYTTEMLALNEAGVKIPAKKTKSALEYVIAPDYFLEHLENNQSAKSVFFNFSNSHRKDIFLD